MEPTDAWSAVLGANIAAQAVNIAGYLAECGVRTLQLRREGAHCQLLARMTDLPGELANCLIECEMSGGDVEMRLLIVDESRQLQWRKKQ